MAADRPLRVLLVEDDDNDVLFFRRAIRAQCERMDLEVVRDGQEAVQRLLREDVPLPDHIVLDLKLPRRSGIEVLSWIRSTPNRQSLSVTVLTSSGEPSDLERVQELGIDEYILKPVSYQELVTVVGGLCAKWQASRAPTPGS